jgi:alkylated DNA nucleotide flippase Atl1
MQYEHVFSVKDSTAIPLNPIDLSAVGFLERQHLQEWIVANPTVLGDDVKIVTVEFDRWQTFTGDAKKDRLDILAIDSGGRLVIAELKRGAATSHVDLQALKYAAAVSRFDPDTLIDAHHRFLEHRLTEAITRATAKAHLEAHIDGPLESETWSQPRIVLVAHSYDESVTNTVVWLSESGLDIVLLRYQLYATAADPLFVVSQMYPTPETEQFVLAPRREEVEQTKEKTKAEQRQKDSVKILAAEGALEVNTPLHLEPSGVNEELREAVARWLDEDATRAEGHWTGDPAAPIYWAYKGGKGKPSTFASEALELATGVKRALNGAAWWVTDDGSSLADLAAQYVEAKKTTRDWSDLHSLLELLPQDRWTTYGDVATAIGTAPQPLGQHLLHCSDCVNAVHVLTAEGKPAEHFKWGNPDETRSPREVLEERGIVFSPSGAADLSQRLSAAQLLVLTAQA